MIQFRNVTKIYGSGETAVRAVNDLSFTCPQAAFWTIMGPSGSGKSTVLHLIAGLTPPSSGQVLVGGDDVSRMSAAEAAALRRRRVGYVLQTFNLMPFLSAAENIAMPLVLDGLRSAEVEPRVREALDLVHMAHRAGHYPAHLSGGEQQRIAVARALVIRPAIVLADEPTGPVFAAYATRVLRLVDGSLQQDMDLADEGGDRELSLVK